MSKDSNSSTPGTTLPTPPQAEKRPRVRELHGVEWEDPYAWLEDRENPEVLHHLEAENAYTEAVLAPTEEFQQKLYEEMVGRIQETDQGVPVRIDEYFYYTRTEEGLQYPIYCRKHGSLDAEEQVLLDLNTLAEEHEYLKLGVYEVSPDHRLLAWSLDVKGSERFVLYIRNLESGEELADEVENTARSLEWDSDSRAVYYVTLDEARRPHIAWRHTLGEAVKEDQKVYEEEDERFFLSLFKTRSRRFIGMQLGSHTTAEMRYLDTQNSEAGWKVLAPRRQDVEIYFDHRGDEFYILSNRDARNFRLLRTAIDQPEEEHWEEVVPHREDETLDGLHLFQDHMVLAVRSGGLRNLRIHQFSSGEWYDLEHDEPVFTAGMGSNPMFDAPELRFVYTSLLTPSSVYDHEWTTRRRELRKRIEVLGDFDPADYRSERLWVEAKDGVRIPVSLMMRHDRPSGGPLLLYGYGSYGHSIDPTFSSVRLSLVDRGMAFAIAHIRGGGEMGRGWYETAKLENKERTFDDFIAVAEHLVEEGYTTSEGLVIRGGSAGGLLIGAVINSRPDLFAAALAEVPFVDVLNTMLDPELPLTVIEYEEWGNPEEARWFEVIRAYSPYENVGPKDYPHLLITAGLNDPRVQYFEPAKWTARLREHTTGGDLLLFKVAMGSGHGGASGRYDYLKEEATKQAFVLEVLGLRES